MSNFFVGQRVRIVSCDSPENYHKIGMEGRIIETVEADDGLIYGLDIDPVTYSKPQYDGYYVNTYVYGYEQDQLEPILPDGAVKGDFSFHELMDNLKTKEQHDVLSLHA